MEGFRMDTLNELLNLDIVPFETKKMIDSLDYVGESGH